MVERSYMILEASSLSYILEEIGTSPRHLSSIIEPIQNCILLVV
jgi:hypothetical protein